MSSYYEKNFSIQLGLQKGSQQQCYNDKSKKESHQKNLIGFLDSDKLLLIKTCIIDKLRKKKLNDSSSGLSSVPSVKIKRNRSKKRDRPHARTCGQSISQTNGASQTCFAPPKTDDVGSRLEICEKSRRSCNKQLSPKHPTLDFDSFKVERDVSNEVWNAENVAFCIKNRSSPTHNLGATITTYVKSLGNHLPESSHLTSFKHKRHKCSAVARLKRLRINNVDGRHTSAWKIKSRKSANHRKGRNVFSSCGSGKSATDTTNFQEGGVVCSSLRKEEQTPLKFLFKKENTEFRHANFSRKVSSRCENLSKARMQHDPIFVNDEKVNKMTASCLVILDSKESSALNRVVKLCAFMHRSGWAPGSAGSILVKINGKLYMVPEGIPKDNVTHHDVVIKSLPQAARYGCVGATIDCAQADNQRHCSPSSGCAYKNLEPSLWPLWTIYDLFDAGAIFHCQSQAAVLASLVAGNEFRIANQEMLEVLTIGFTTITHRFDEQLVIPIVENGPAEELCKNLQTAIDLYPDTNALLVRCHGAFIWGETWQAVKSQ